MMRRNLAMRLPWNELRPAMHGFVSLYKMRVTFEEK